MRASHLRRRIVPGANNSQSNGADVPAGTPCAREAQHVSEFTDEQLELRDSARAALARECPAELVRDVADGGRGGDDLADRLAWLGWPALTMDVDLGGLGRSFVELAIVIEELGRAVARRVLPTLTQFVPVVREVGTEAQAHRFLAGVARAS